jgi:hypothetical protein
MRHAIRIQPYLSRDLVQKLRAYAAARSETVSGVVATALGEYLERDPQATRPRLRRRSVGLPWSRDGMRSNAVGSGVRADRRLLRVGARPGRPLARPRHSEGGPRRRHPDQHRAARLLEARDRRLTVRACLPGGGRQHAAEAHEARGGPATRDAAGGPRYRVRTSTSAGARAARTARPRETRAPVAARSAPSSSSPSARSGRSASTTFATRRRLCC